MTRSLFEHLVFRARLRPHALAVFGAAGPVSYQALVRDVDALATELLARNLGREDMVGILMATSYLHLLLILALDRLSIPSMSLAQAEPMPALAAAARDFHLTVLISAAVAPAEPPCRWIQMADQHRPRLAPADAARLAALDSPPDALLRVQWSSGTTGGLKGGPTIRTQQGAWSADRQMLHGLGLHTRYFVALPFSSPSYHFMCATLAAGGAIILPGPAADFISYANALGVTLANLPPVLLAEAVDLARRMHQRLETIECIDISGAHLPSKVAEEARAVLTPNLRLNYGATETAQVAAADAAVCIADPAAVGYPLPWARVEIVDAADRPLPAGSEGMVRTRTMHMIPGYYKNPELTRRNFRDGWFYPGDLGSIGADGLLRITGRVEDVILRDGATISPLPIEDAIRGLPGVRDVAVFALRAGAAQEICAALVLEPAADAAAIQAGAAVRLGDQAPARMFQVEQLPRNPNGKVLRRELIDWVMRGDRR
jgi:acyl-CoA synthetase (AMP-forming)/AMP-acid ligase II